MTSNGAVKTMLLRYVLGAALSVLGATMVHAAAAANPSVCPMDGHLEFHRCALQAAGNFKPKSVVAGKPDLSGLWRRRASAYESVEAHPQTDDDKGGPSMVVDPADGKVPYQPWALARVEYNAKHYMHHHAACLPSDVPDSMYQDNVYEFVQTPQRLVILWQKAHGWRNVPLDGTPFLNPAIRLWRGDSRGSWDGNTLVIETVNQTGIPWLDQRGRFVTSDVHAIERFTMIDENTIHYSVTLQDANVLTRPFTMAMALRREMRPGLEITEEACHESNAFTIQQMERIGFGLYPGVTPEQARAAARAPAAAH